jgi:signal transduction histidine kinase
MLHSLAPDPERRTVHALAELSRSVGTGWDASVISRILRFDAEALHVERVSFWSLCEETSSIHCDAGYVASLQSFEHGATLFESDLPEYFAAVREARALDIGDVQTDPRCRGMRDYCASRGIASMLDVPVWLEGRLCGVLCHEHVGATRRWSAQDEDFATSVGQAISSVLAARARSRAESGARRAALLDTASRLLSSLDAREIADRAVSLCVPTFADASLLWVLNRDGALECIALKHRDPLKHDLLVGAYRSGRLTGALSARVMRQAQSLLFPDVTDSSAERFGFTATERAIVESLGARTAMSVPLAVGEKTFGAMTFAANDRRYDADDLAMAESIAGRVASALENARLYAVAREAIRARDELLVLTAHELRTPLTALQLRADGLLRSARRGADADQTARSEGIARDVRRFSVLVDHMLDALNIRADGVALVSGRCDLARMVRDRVGLVAERARTAGSEIKVDSPPSVTGQWDRARLETVIDVVLDNAIKYGNGAPISVSLRADGAWAELSVRDQGIGIPEDRLSAIFQPFERAVPKEHFGGLGLGLYIAKAIVDAHGGSIAVTSRLGEGSAFVVRLPLAATRLDREV